MPKATVNENDDALGWKYHIGLAGKPLVMKSVTETGGVKKAAHAKFGLRVLMPD